MIRRIACWVGRHSYKNRSAPPYYSWRECVRCGARRTFGLIPPPAPNPPPPPPPFRGSLDLEQ